MRFLRYAQTKTCEFLYFQTKSLPEYKIPELKVDKDLLDITKLKTDVSEAGSPIPLLKNALKTSNDVLNYRYKEGQDINCIVREGLESLMKF